MDTVGVTSQATLAGPAGVRDEVGQAQFLTGEAVHLDVRTARLGSRMLARLLDLVVQVGVYFLVSFALTMLFLVAAVLGVATLDDASVNTISILTVVVTIVGYPVLMETLTRGRTLGKMIVGLRVVRDDGGPITFRQALSRNLVGVAIEFPGILAAPITWLATVWTMIASPQSKRIGDYVAGTVVIHERTPAAWGWVPQMPPGLAGWAATLDLAGLDDDLALVVRHYLARNRQIREPARTQLGIRLAQEVAACTNPPPPTGVAGWAYLAAVHAERHQRATRLLVARRGRAAAVWPDLAAAVAPPSPPMALIAPYHTPAQPNSARPQ